MARWAEFGGPAGDQRRVGAGFGRGMPGSLTAWYYSGTMPVVAMNLRLSDEDAAQLKALAEAEGVSMHEAALRAIRRNAEELAHGARVRSVTADMMDRWGDVLDRLGNV